MAAQTDYSYVVAVQRPFNMNAMLLKSPLPIQFMQQTKWNIEHIKVELATHSETGSISANSTHISNFSVFVIRASDVNEENAFAKFNEKIKSIVVDSIETEMAAREKRKSKEKIRRMREMKTKKKKK